MFAISHSTTMSSDHQTLLVIKDRKITPIQNNSQETIDALIKSIIRSDPDTQEPFYVLDLGTVADLHTKWTQHLDFVQPYYAVKCNPEPALIATLAFLGVNFDCASPTEMDSVLAHGVEPNRIVYANACKSESHIRYARDLGVGLTTFDSVYELEKMKRHHPGCRLLIRIKPPVNTGVRRSLESKYGAYPEEIATLLEVAKEMNLSVVGVSFHIGTSATVFETYDAAIGLARRVFDTADKVNGVRMTMLNLGGGFTVGHLFGEEGRSIEHSVKYHFGDRKGLKVIAEPGRYFAETTTTLATCVIGKRIRGKKREYWLNDGIYGSMNCMKMDAVNVEVVPLERREEGTKTYVSTVFGPTCDSFDVIGGDLQLPEMEVGEWMVSPNMGAYAKAMGSSFNGFSTQDIKVYLASSKDHI